MNKDISNLLKELNKIDLNKLNPELLKQLKEIKKELKMLVKLSPTAENFGRFLFITAIVNEFVEELTEKGIKV